MIENKLGITNSAELARREEEISKREALRLWDEGILDKLKAGTFHSLSEIHRHLFEEIYDFAGQLRVVDMSKGSFRFASIRYLKSAVESVEKMPQSTFDEIIEKYVEMNVAHPFREGNGRSGRIWLDLILKQELGLVVDWNKVDKNDYFLAMERSPVKDFEIKHLIKQALTDKIYDREVFMKGIDVSYHYEGYNLFKTEDISNSKNAMSMESWKSEIEKRKESNSQGGQKSQVNKKRDSFER